MPDVDSDSSIPIREVMCFAAAVTPMLMLDRLQHMGLSHSAIVVASACIYIIVRFGVGDLLRAVTVHRGMFHSVPAAIIAGLVASIVCSCEDMTHRFFKVFAVALGYMTHLVLDELASISLKRGQIQFKKSFGTAVKFWGNRAGPNLLTYTLLVFMVVAAIGDPLLMEKFGYHPPHSPGTHSSHDSHSDLSHSTGEYGDDDVFDHQADADLEHYDFSDFPELADEYEYRPRRR